MRTPGQVAIVRSESPEGKLEPDRIARAGAPGQLVACQRGDAGQRDRERTRQGRRALALGAEALDRGTAVRIPLQDDALGGDAPTQERIERQARADDVRGGHAGRRPHPGVAGIEAADAALARWRGQELDDRVELVLRRQVGTAPLGPLGRDRAGQRQTVDHRQRRGPARPTGVDRAGERVTTSGSRSGTATARSPTRLNTTAQAAVAIQAAAASAAQVPSSRRQAAKVSATVSIPHATATSRRARALGPNAQTESACA
jgi:hypothetical protein